MPIHEIKRFHHQIKNDFYFFKLSKNVVEEKNNQKIVEFAKKHGYEFNEQELKDFLKDKLNNEELEELYKTTNKTKILIISANPWDTKRISPDEEYREIQAVWHGSKLYDHFVLKYVPAASDAELRQYLLNFEPNIVHFSGHGETDGLCFQDATGNTQFITKEALTNLFGLFAKQIKCVVLNACHTEEHAQAIAEHVENVIGMKTAIGDIAAVKFATGFYQALFSGKEIDFAFDFGCRAIELVNIPECGTPTIKKKIAIVSQINNFRTTPAKIMQ